MFFLLKMLWSYNVNITNLRGTSVSSWLEHTLYEGRDCIHHGIPLSLAPDECVERYSVNELIFPTISPITSFIDITFMVLDKIR